MQAIWELTPDDYLEIVKRARAGGVKEGESIEKYLFQYMEEKGQKPKGHTELSQDELIKEYNSHGKKAIGFSTKDGKTIIKRMKNENE